MIENLTDKIRVDNSLKVLEVKFEAIKKMTTDTSIDTHYLHQVFDINQFTKISEWAAREVNRIRQYTHVDSIAAMGSSGMLMAGAVSVKTGIPITLVRKSLDGSHAQEEHFGCGRDCVEGKTKGNYIIIDDMIATGRTIIRIIDAIYMKNANRKCAGIILYRSLKSHYPSLKNEQEMSNHFKDAIFACKRGGVQREDFDNTIIAMRETDEFY
jgi:adenine/guanine phosphoribosyltransferase-like PRPP-binding protein